MAACLVFLAHPSDGALVLQQGWAVESQAPPACEIPIPQSSHETHACFFSLLTERQESAWVSSALCVLIDERVPIGAPNVYSITQMNA